MKSKKRSQHPMRPFTVSLPSDLRTALERVAREEKRAPSAVARIAIEEFIERRTAAA